jgi:hypothetical protein
MTEQTLTRANKDDLLAAINRNTAYIVQDVLYPEFLKELKHQGVVEIFADAVYSYGKQDTYVISAALRGFEIEPWDLTRICSASNLCEPLLELNEGWQGELLQFLGGQKTSISQTSRLCAEHLRDLHYQLVVSIDLRLQEEPPGSE